MRATAIQGYRISEYVAVTSLRVDDAKRPEATLADIRETSVLMDSSHLRQLEAGSAAFRGRLVCAPGDQAKEPNGGPVALGDS